MLFLTSILSLIDGVAWFVWHTSKTLTPFIARNAILIKQTKQHLNFKTRIEAEPLPKNNARLSQVNLPQSVRFAFSLSGRRCLATMTDGIIKYLSQRKE